MTTGIERRLEEHFRGIDGVVSAYLFGSHAEGRASRESDIDVGVLLDYERYPSQESRFDLRVDLMSDLAPALGENAIDVVILNDAPPTLGRHIVTGGQRVYCADAELDHAFVRDVQIRAADIAPFLHRMARVKLDSMQR